MGRQAEEGAMTADESLARICAAAACALAMLLLAVCSAWVYWRTWMRRLFDRRDEEHDAEVERLRADLEAARSAVERWRQGPERGEKPKKNLKPKGKARK